MHDHSHVFQEMHDTKCTHDKACPRGKVPFLRPTWKFGSGSISLPLVNLRFNYSFWIFRWNESEVDPNHLDQDHNPLPGTAHLFATSDDELSFESSRVPDQIHLAYMDEDDEMRVMFVTPDGAGEEEGLLW
ncbi:hypothetical protein ACFX13_012356 [Malus domestica]